MNNMMKLTQQEYETIAAKYNEIVVGNTDANWNAAAAVIADSTGEVIYELSDIAFDLGFEVEGATFDRLYDVWYKKYRGKLKETADKFPVKNGEDGYDFGFA